MNAKLSLSPQMDAITPEEEITPLVAELSGIISVEDAERYDAEYADSLTKKYR